LAALFGDLPQDAIDAINKRRRHLVSLDGHSVSFGIELPEDF